MCNNQILCRLLLPYERYQRGEETTVRLNHGRRIKNISVSEDLEIKEEPSDPYFSETPPPVEAISATTPPLQSIMSAAATVNNNLINKKLFYVNELFQIIHVVSLEFTDLAFE